jgi:hypothetical protein
VSEGWTLEKLNMAYEVWLFSRMIDGKLGDKSMQEIDSEHRAGQHDDDFKLFVRDELASKLAVSNESGRTK